MFGNKSGKLRELQVGDGFTHHFDFVSDKLATGIGVVFSAFNITKDLRQQTISFLDSFFFFNIHHQRCVDIAKTRLTHTRTFGGVFFIVSVSQGFVMLDISGHLHHGMIAFLVLDVHQLYFLNGQAFKGLSFISKRLGNQTIHGLDALNDESLLVDFTTENPDKIHMRPLVLTACAASDVALHTGGADIVKDGQVFAFVKITVLDDFINGETLAELRYSQQLRVGNQLLLGDAANVIPGLTFTTGTTLHGVVDGVLGVIGAVLFFVEDTRSSIELQLQLGGNGALEVDSPQRFRLADPGINVPLMDKEHLVKPIQMKIVNGRIENVAISKSEPLWTVNFKRAVAAQLQLQLDGASGVFHKEEHSAYYAENTVYYTMEGCTSGECQTWYHISRIPKQQLVSNPQLLAVPELCEGFPVYEIVKNRDFDKCKNLPVFNYISTPGMQCDVTSGASCQNEWAHVDLVRILGCKINEETFIVQRIKTMDRLVTKPLAYETEALEGLTIQKIELVDIKNQKSDHTMMKMPADVQHYKSLTYAYDEEHATEGSRMSQPGLRDINTPLVMNVEKEKAIKEADRLLSEILRDIEGTEYYTDPSGKFVADKIEMMRKAISNLEFPELSAFVSKHLSKENDEWSPVSQVILDALVISGTNPSVMIVRDWILKGRLQGEQAVIAISTLPATIKTPTKQLLINLIELMKSEVVTSNRDLKFATALSVSRLVYQACVNSTTSTNLFPKMVMGEFCSVRDPLVTRQLVPWLNEQLKKATDDVERIAMMAALGNIGHEVIIPSILPHISSCEPSSHFEAQWYERHRRSMRDDEEPMIKKEWRKKWLTYKKKHHNKEASVEELLDQFEEELRSEMEEEKTGGKSQKKTHRPEHKKENKKDNKKSAKLSKKDEKKERKAAKKDGKEYEELEEDIKMDEKEDKEAFKSAKKEEKDEFKSGKKDEKKEIKSMVKEEKQEIKKMKSEIKTEKSNEKEFELFNEFTDEEDVVTDFEEDVEEEEDSLSMEDVEDMAACNILRTKAIYALSTMAVNKHEIVSKILMPVYFNKAEETEIRLAALSLLFISNPPVAFWERVALSTWVESNDQVSHYIYTTIASLVSNKDPKRRDITQRAESVLPMMKPMRWTSFVSSNYLKAGYEEKTRLGYLTKTVNFPGYESFIPSNHYNSLYLTFGPWFTRLFDVSINSKQPEKFLDKLLGKTFLRGKSNKDESLHTHPDLEKIQKELKIEARATGQPEIFIYVNFMDNYQRFLAITPLSIEKMVEKLIRNSVERSARSESSFSVHKVLPMIDVFVRVPSAMGLAYSGIGQVRLFASVKTDTRTNVDFKSMKSLRAQTEGTIMPVFNLDICNKITLEMPFSRSYPTAGVHVEMIVAMPGRFSIIADMDKANIETSWEFLGGKLRLARHAVIPYTTIRKLGDYTPSLLLPETKPIMLLNKPLQTETPFGGQALGLNMLLTERGDVQALRAPNAYNQDWFGYLLFSALPSTLRYHETNLFLDQAKSETKIIKSSFSIVVKQGEEVNSELLEEEERENKGLMKKMKKVDERDIFEQFGRKERKFQELFNQMAEPVGYSLEIAIELVGSAKPRVFGTSLSYGVGDYGRSHRGSLKVEKRFESEMGENFVLCVDVDAKLPRPSVVRREEFLRDDISRTSSIKIGFGKSCTDDRKIIINAQMARSEDEIPSTIQSQMQERQCAKQELFGRGVSEECLSTRRLAAILNKGVVTIDYNEMPGVVRNVTTKVSNLFRRWMGEHMSDNQVDVKNTASQIRIETVYYPIIGSMDLRVYKPESNTFYHGINIHPLAEAVLPFNPRLTAFRAVYGGPGLCMVDRDSVTTYDGLTYNTSIEGCDQLITKDCSGRYKMAVLAREEKNAKVVTVYLNREKIEINPAQKKAKVNEVEHVFNDVSRVYQVRDVDQDIIALIRMTSDGFMEVDSPSHLIRVTASAEEVILLNSPIHRGRLCGLCGSQTGDKITDLAGPKKCPLPENLMSVAYELRQPAGCKSVQTPGEKEVLRRIQDKCIKEESHAVFGLTDRRPMAPMFQQHVLSMGIRSAETDCDLSRNRMIHRGRKRCFSVEPALKCSAGCQPAEFETVKMGFHCLPSGPLSDQLKEALPIRPLDELAGMEVTNMAVLRVPSSCTPSSVRVEDKEPKSHRHH
uniref:Copper-zinc cu-zn superoxide dismutase n=1 Tax=Daphnia magna TaxID=35525 RepID=A0A0P6FDP9_9CRUS